ncbi:hypothetical protein EXE53_33340, partial [Halorubrum sp. SD626R]
TMETKEQNVRDGISTWVSNVYGDVQSGEIEITELITPRDRAARAEIACASDSSSESIAARSRGVMSSVISISPL